MKESKPFTALQTGSLVFLRFLIGWHILYEGLSKLLVTNWSSAGFLQESKWILSGFAGFILEHDYVLKIVDFLNTWGLIAIGLGLIFGLFTRTACLAGTFLLLLYYACNPPLIGLEYTIPSEGSYLVISKTLIESAALFVLALCPTSSTVGLDMFIERYTNLRKDKKA
jgi:thiosulfate dehydrogenase [quinone] large subunit